MAYGFIKQSDGHIKIYTEVGHGTVIKIYLPRSFEKEEQKSASSIVEVQGGSETILVVEDDLSVQETAVELLSGLGYKVLRADNAEIASELLKNGAVVDLLFTDVVMPGKLRSPELAQQAKLLLPDIKVLFTSGYTQNAIVHGGRLDPGVHLLTKPYGRDQLARKIRELLTSDLPALPAKESTEIHDAYDTNFTGLRIGFVEDNEDFRQIGAELMSVLGHQVTTFACAEDALQHLVHGKFDVLLTDVSLPGMSGIELAITVAKLYPQVRVILVSGFGGAVADNMDYPFEVLAKPLALDRLQMALKVLDPENM